MGRYSKKILSLFLAFTMILTLLPATAAKAEETTQTIVCSKAIASNQTGEIPANTCLVSVGGEGTGTSTEGSSAAAAYVSGETASSSTPILGGARMAGIGFDLSEVTIENPNLIRSATVTIHVQSVNTNMSNDSLYWTKAGLFAVDASRYDTISADEESFPAKNADYSKNATVFCKEKIAGNDTGEKTFDVTDWIVAALKADETKAVFRLQTVMGGWYFYHIGENAPTLSITTITEQDAVDQTISSLFLPSIVRNKITLPEEGICGSKVTWDVGESGIIESDGTVNAPKEATDVTLTATVTNGNVSKSKAFTVTVKPVDETLIAEYAFEGNATTDMTIGDISGKENDATLKGEGASIANGVLTLPGGAAGSKAAYVELPGTMFENQNTLTITTWLKNETGANNYAAMFFGTPTKHIGGGTSDRPLHYWLLNPKETDHGGMFKSVWTDGDNENTPYSTETAVSSTATSSDWGMYTTVITPDRIIGYYNGAEVSNVTKTKTTKDFGTGLVAYIGRSGYNDMFYKGGVYGVRVYTRALEQQEIWDEYFNEYPNEVNMGNIIDTSLAADVKTLDLGDLSHVTKSLTLPDLGDNGSKITWSSDSDAIAQDGTVTRDPGKDILVTLTANLTIGSKNATKEFPATVIAATPQNLVNEFVDSLTVPKVADADFILPDALDEHITIAWQSSNDETLTVQNADGVAKAVINRSGSGAEDTKVTLTANVKYEDGTVTVEDTKTFEITIRAEYGYAYLMAYTRSSGESTALGSSLHVAVSVNGADYEALNSNTGICFANNAGGSKNSSPNGLKNLYIFRKADGTYGLAATNVSTQKYIYIFDSENLVDFTNERKLAVSSNVSGSIKVTQTEEGYKVNWSDGSKQYGALTKDFQTVISQGEESYTPDTVSVTGAKPDGAELGSILSLNKSEYQYVINRLGVVKNTGIKPIDDITVAAGADADLDSLLPKTVTAEYNDGSEVDMNVVWDTSAVDLFEEGTYTATGTIQQTKYANPFIEQRADPCILKGNDGYYYFTASYPMFGNNDKNGYDRVVLRRAETIEGLAEAEETTIWHCDDYSDEYRYIWAPEIRLVNNNYYVFYTSSVDSSVWSIRPHVLKCTNADDIMNPESWEAKGIMQKTASDTQAFNGFSLDMTVFENQDHWYVVWAQTDVFSSLFIAEIDPDEPWKCISESVKISVPEFSWERINENVNEGPSIIKGKNGKIYMAFSASGTGSEYCIGLLSIDEKADMLDASAWKKQAYPVLTSADVPGEYGPGHNSFTVDENGNDIFVYHARGQECYDKQCGNWSGGSLYDPCRDARLKRVHWSVDGAPILKMSYEEELAETEVEISVSVTMTDEMRAAKAAIDKIELSPSDLELKVDETAELKLTYPDRLDDVLKAAGISTERTVAYSSEDTSVATVDETDGTITAVGAGSAEITAEISFGKIVKTLTTTVTVTKNDQQIAEEALDAVIVLENYALVLGQSANITDAMITYPLDFDTKIEAADLKKSITFAVSGGAVSLDETAGTIRAAAEGTATLTIKIALLKGEENVKELTKNVTITVNTQQPPDTQEALEAAKASLQNVTLAKESYDLTVGDTAELTINYPTEFTDALAAAGLKSDVTYGGQNASVTVADGKLTAVAEGTANITVTVALDDADKTSKTLTAAVTVKAKETNGGNGEGGTDTTNVSVNKITIQAPSKKLAAGKTVKLTATVAPANATNNKVTWKVSNTKYATISETGSLKLKGSAAGKTITVTATAADGSGKKATIKITIMKNAVKSVKIKATSKTLKLKAGKTMTLKATVKTTGSKVNKTLAWKSSNTKYATVTKKGKVKALKAGKGKTVTITATSTDGSNKKASVKIKITK